MVPFLNKVGTDVACVGVSMGPARHVCTLLIYVSRTTILILEWPNSAIWQVSVVSLGYWRTSSIQHWEMISRLLTVERPVC